MSYGISFWIVPAISACQTVTATQLGDPSAAAFYVSLYTITVTIAFMVCGANSDLFGRRYFIVGGNVIMFVGFIMGGAAKNNTTMLAAMSFIGFVSLISTHQGTGANLVRVPVTLRFVYRRTLSTKLTDLISLRHLHSQSSCRTNGEQPQSCLQTPVYTLPS
jgi:MFS family permease